MISVSGNYWEEIRLNKNSVEKIKQDHNFSDILAKLIISKKFNDDEINSLNNNYKIRNFFIENKDFKVSSDLFINSINNKEKICILGDYDVDGSSSTALVVRFLNKINHPHFFYIPDRVNDGYGASVKLFKKLLKLKPKLIIMLDCGSSANIAINFLNKNKIKSIIIDHHQITQPFPNANCIINPKKNDYDNKNKYLCATTLTYFFLDIVKQKMKLNINLEEYIIYVLLATICDVMPLRNLNRFLAIDIMKNFDLNKNKALKEIYNLCKKKNKINVDDIGYIIGPILNSGGRLNKSQYATELLSSDDNKLIKKRAKELFDLNEKRKLIEKRTLNNINLDKLKKNNEIIILNKSNINEGIIGIIASKLKEYFNLPSFVITNSGNYLKGSARSVEGFDLGLMVKNAKDQNLIISGGGHEMAAGFVLKKDKIDNFIRFSNSIFLKNINNIKKKSFYDFKISNVKISQNFLNDLKRIEPFGNLNTEPIFLIENLIILKPKILNTKHIFCILKSKSGNSIKSICFNCAENNLGKFLLNYKKKINVIGHFRQNNWKLKNSLQFLIKDLIA